nr:MAG TPA: hypothetical protein [Caudoviricetes sp.]
MRNTRSAGTWTQRLSGDIVCCVPRATRRLSRTMLI